MRGRGDGVDGIDERGWERAMSRSPRAPRPGGKRYAREVTHRGVVDRGGPTVGRFTSTAVEEP